MLFFIDFKLPVLKILVVSNTFFLPSFQPLLDPLPYVQRHASSSFFMGPLAVTLLNKKGGCCYHTQNVYKIFAVFMPT